MARPNWLRGLGAGLSTLGQYMAQDAMIRRREEERQRLYDQRLAEEQARYERNNPFVVDANMVRSGGMAPVGVPGYQPDTARTDLSGYLRYMASMQPQPAPEGPAMVDFTYPAGVPDIGGTTQSIPQTQQGAMTRYYYPLPDAGGAGGAGAAEPDIPTLGAQDRVIKETIGNPNTGAPGPMLGDPVFTQLGLETQGSGRNMTAPWDDFVRASIPSVAAGTRDSLRTGRWPASPGTVNAAFGDYLGGLPDVSVPEIDLNNVPGLGWDRFDSDSGVFVDDKTLRPDEYKTMSEAAAEIQRLVDESQNGMLTWAMIESALKKEPYGLSKKQITEIAPKLASAEARRALIPADPADAEAPRYTPGQVLRDPATGTVYVVNENGQPVPRGE